ncbi:hypothetical protein M426DRAFT_254547 [Hypoxylon sp. CI-4A]|nr:hypothetical protein M426DRAFT_254547 [Hypoxylon sp. CI-4A]
MFGQFPISNWLADRLDATREEAKSDLSPEGHLEPQVTNFGQYLDRDQYTDLDSNPYLSSSTPSGDFDPCVGLSSLVREDENVQVVDLRSGQGSPDPPAQPGFACNACDASFTSQGRLNAHKRRHEKKHRCEQCDRRFSESRDLYRHIQSVHESLWEQCPQCEKKLKRRGDNIRRHMIQ